MAQELKNYKDRLFCFIFGNEEHRDWTLSLYNAVSGRNYTDPGEITITTMTEALYMGMHNDVAILIRDELDLWERQASFNPNMPLRMLQYTANIFEKLIALRKKNKFGTKLIELPVPKLVVFYNGLQEREDEMILKLSEAFPAEQAADSDIDVRVRMININKGRNTKMVSGCKALEEYVWLVDRIRDYQKEYEVSDAVDLALNDMPDDFVIRVYLEANRVEVKKMLLTEYDEVRTMELFKEEGREEGRAEGESRLSTLFTKLRELGRTEDAFKAAEDQQYREKLYKEFQLA